jgi:chromosome segregation ATPase
MSDRANFVFVLFQDRLLPPAGSFAIIAVIAILSLISLVLFVKLKRSRTTIQKLGERLGYELPLGDGSEILDQEDERASVERQRANNVEELEQRIVDMESEAARKDTELASHRQRWQELEGQLAAARVENESATARANELALAHQAVVEQMHKKEAEDHANLTAVQERSRDLEGQLQQASLWGNKVTTMANEQAQTHRTLVEQLEQRIRDMEAEHIADLTSHQRQQKELEDRLHQTSMQHEQNAAQSSEQVQTHQATVAQLEQRIRQMEVEGQAYLSALERHARELEDQLRRALIHNEQLAGQAGAQEQAQRVLVVQLEERIHQLEAGSGNVELLQKRKSELEEELRRAGIRTDGIAAQASEQVQAYRTTIENLEQRVRDIEAEGMASSTAILQRTRELEAQLREAHQEKEAAAAHVEQQAQAHRGEVEQLEGRIRRMETDGVAAMSGLEEKAKQLEEQLWQARLEKDAAAAQATEHVQAHQGTIEGLEERVRQLEAEGAAGVADLQQRARELEAQLQHTHREKDTLAAQAGELTEAQRNSIQELEQRLRTMEAENAAGLTTLHRHSADLEEQLRQAQLKMENDNAAAQQEAADRNSDKARLDERIRELEAEKDRDLSRVQSLEAQVTELDERLRTAASLTIAPATGTATVLLRKAEWIAGCAVGPVLPFGLVAAEAYASAALADDPENRDAAGLVAELARIHRAYREGLPPVAESIATFDEKAAAFFAADSAGAAEVAEDEARRRARAGLNRSALLAVNAALELRQKTDLPESQPMLELKELKATLVERLGNDAAAVMDTVRLP